MHPWLWQVLHCEMQWPLGFFRMLVCTPDRTFQKNLTYDVESENVPMEKRHIISQTSTFGIFSISSRGCTCLWPIQGLSSNRRWWYLTSLFSWRFRPMLGRIPHALVRLEVILVSGIPWESHIEFRPQREQILCKDVVGLPYVYREPQTTIKKWMFGETTISYVKIGNHPIETTIYKWLFGVPGMYYFFQP